MDGESFNGLFATVEALQNTVDMLMGVSHAGTVHCLATRAFAPGAAPFARRLSHNAHLEHKARPPTFAARGAAARRVLVCA